MRMFARSVFSFFFVIIQTFLIASITKLTEQYSSFNRRFWIRANKRRATHYNFYYYFPLLYRPFVVPLFHLYVYKPKIFSLKIFIIIIEKWRRKKKLRTQKNNNDNSFPVSFYVCIAYTDRSVHDHNCHIKIKSEEKMTKWTIRH